MGPRLLRGVVAAAVLCLPVAVLALLDPPYPLSEEDLAAVLAALADDWLAPGAIVVVERSARSPEPTWPPGLERFRHKEHGETALWFAEPVLKALGQQPDIAALAGQYMRVLQWSLVLQLFVMVLRSFLSAIERPRIVLVALVIGVVVNAILNYVLIFGHLGLPAMGMAGSGLATLIAVGAVALGAVGAVIGLRSVGVRSIGAFGDAMAAIDAKGLRPVLKPHGLLTRDPRVVGHHDQPRTRAQSHGQFEDGHVEPDGRELQHHRARRQPHPVLGRRHQRRDALVRNDDALGTPRGA